MKALMNYLVETLIIVAKLIILSVIFQIFLKILVEITREPLQWFNTAVPLDSKIFIAFLAYILLTTLLFYLVGRFALSFLGKPTTNFIFAILVFLLAMSGLNLFGRANFYSLVNFYFNFEDWFNFEIHLGNFKLGNNYNYMKLLDWIIITFAVYFGMKSGLKPERNRYKTFTKEEEEEIYEAARKINNRK